MEHKNKKCKICKKKFKPFNTIQSVCSTKCALKHTENKKKQKEEYSELMKKGLEDRIDEIKLSKDLENTRKQVHNFIHQRDKGKPCVSCNRPNDNNFDAGHFYKAELYSSLKFNVDNIHLQCKHCNRYLEGNVSDYAIQLEKRIGKERIERLKELVQNYNQSSFKWDREQLKEIRNQIKELKNNL